MRCNGKCHLMKELAKSSETDKPLNSDKKGIIKQETETLYCEVITKYFSLTFLLENSRNKVGHYSNLYTSIPSSSVFHPPCFA
ncbi:MAG: hypothetical protein RL427_878 [Bacteroidota bacterium]|jgi:hypothetical protein